MGRYRAVVEDINTPSGYVGVVSVVVYVLRRVPSTPFISGVGVVKMFRKRLVLVL